MRKAKPEFSSDIEAHLHADLNVTRERLEAFGTDRVETQLKVMAVLRARADNQEAGQLLGVHSMSIAVLALILTLIPRLVPAARPFRTGPYWWIEAIVLLIVIVAIDFIVVAVLAPIIIDQFKLNRRREYATAWLGAYQDELARLRRGTGKAGRDWRRSHPL